MPRPDLTDDLCSDREEAAYEARMERQRNQHHWCMECHGRTGPGSPCGKNEPEDNEQESSDE